MSTNKNPFEIRLETLKMAKEMMDQAYATQMDMIHQALEQWKEAGKDAQEFLAEYTPKMYQPKKLLRKRKNFMSTSQPNQVRKNSYETICL